VNVRVAGEVTSGENDVTVIVAVLGTTVIVEQLPPPSPPVGVRLSPSGVAVRPVPGVSPAGVSA
jgi:hypothetical protein